MSETRKPTARDKTKKRRWNTPRVVSTRAAFEHAILTCNGLIPPDNDPGEGFDSRSPKGSCTVGGTASS